jgi:hypothetical protein
VLTPRRQPVQSVERAAGDGVGGDASWSSAGNASWHVLCRSEGIEISAKHHNSIRFTCTAGAVEVEE